MKKNIYLPGGRRVRGFVGIEPLVHPLSVKSAFFTEEVRTTCTVCTRTHPYGKQSQIKTCYRLYFRFLYTVQTVRVI